MYTSTPNVRTEEVYALLERDNRSDLDFGTADMYYTLELAQQSCTNPSITGWEYIEPSKEEAARGLIPYWKAIGGTHEDNIYKLTFTYNRVGSLGHEPHR